MRIGDRTKWLDDDDVMHELINTLREDTHGMRRSALAQKTMFATPMELLPLSADADYDRSMLPPLTGTLFGMKIARSHMPTVWHDTVRSLIALPFRDQFVLTDWDQEMIQGIGDAAPWVNDVDNNGMSIDHLAYSAMADAMYNGVTYLLVDSPSAQQKALDQNLHPYVTMIPRSIVTRIEIDSGGNLVQVGFREAMVAHQMMPNGELKIDQIDAERIITAPAVAWPGEDQNALMVQVFENRNGKAIERPDLAGDGKIAFPDSSVRITLEDIFVPLYGNRVAPYRGHSPFLGTAEVAAALYRAVADMTDLMRSMSLVFVHESGVEPSMAGRGKADKNRGSLRYHVSSNPSARMSFVESTGATLRGIFEVVQSYVHDITTAHKDMWSTRRSGSGQPITATQAAFQGVHAVSDMERYTIQCVAAIDQVLNAMRLLGGLPSKGETSLPTDFGLEAAAIETATTLYREGLMTGENYWDIFLAHRYANPSTFNIDNELSREALQRTIDGLSANPLT